MSTDKIKIQLTKEIVEFTEPIQVLELCCRKSGARCKLTEKIFNLYGRMLDIQLHFHKRLCTESVEKQVMMKIENVIAKQALSDECDEMIKQRKLIRLDIKILDEWIANNDEEKK